MIPWVKLDSAIMADGGELRLMQRGTEFSIMSGTIELMNSRLSGSEEALATLTCGPIKVRKGARILIGGLGMGFTLRAAQAELGEDAQIVVAELVPSVVQWARTYLTPIYGESLSDPRVSIEDGDVNKVIRGSVAAYDAILLDVDNGPQALSRDANNGLYDMTGLNAARRALRLGGILAVWSAFPDPKFTTRMQKAGFAVEEVKVRANGARGGARHVIWVGTSKGAVR